MRILGGGWETMVAMALKPTTCGLYLFRGMTLFYGSNLYAA